MLRLTSATLIAALTTSLGAQADVLSTKGRLSQFDSQTRVLDNRARQQYNNSVRLQPQRFQAPTMWGESAPTFRGVYRGPYLDIARQAARRYRVPEDLFLRLVQQESGWRADAVSHKGAIGLAQLMPQTARVLGVNPHDPRQNLEGGARYLAEQYRGVPPFKETRNYVKVILGS